MVTVARVVAALAIALVMAVVVRRIEPPARPAASPAAPVPTADAARSAERALEALERDLARLTADRGSPPVTVVSGHELGLRATVEGAPVELRYRLIPGPTPGVRRLERAARADDPEAGARAVDDVYLRSMRFRLLLPRPDPSAAWQARSSDANTYLEVLLEATDAAGSASVRRMQIKPLHSSDSTVRQTTKG